MDCVERDGRHWWQRWQLQGLVRGAVRLRLLGQPDQDLAMINALNEVVAYQVHVGEVQVRVSNQIGVLSLDGEAHVYLQILA